ncbi:MAG: hypothetical protein KC613_10720 [Myxococcales bacterium]|nr:hypothetical protein [Myxococcales bacterium]MCB9526633.1 hypothetical protein [Myxococcales bacterium]
MRLLALLALLALTAPAAHAKRFQGHGPFGLGVGIGEPTAVTGKLFLGDAPALQFGASWSFRREWLALYADYLHHMWRHIPSLAGGQIQVPWYVGIGGLVLLDDDDDGFYDKKDDGAFALGARVPVGIALAWTNAPIEVFLEVVPHVIVIPGLHVDFGGQLGARYYF